MEIYQINSFITISETRNLTKAAEKMNISQSAMSSQIKSLEDELSVKLFIRQSKGMALTKEGEELLIEAKKVVRASNQMKKTAMDFQTKISGELNIGINTDPAFLQISDISKRMSQRMPDVNLCFVETQTFETAMMLNEQKIDVGFHYGWINELSISSIALSRETICVVIPKQIADKYPCESLEDICNLPWVWTKKGCPFHMEFQKELDKQGLKLNIITDAVEENIVRELVKSGTGVALMRKGETLLIDQNHAIIWDGVEQDMPLSIACLESRKSDPIISGFLKMLKEKYWSE